MKLSRSTRIRTLAGVGLAVVLLLLSRATPWPGVTTALAEEGEAPRARPAATVTSHVATLEPWTTRIEVTGSLRAERQVQVAPEIAGKVSVVHFESGQTVDAGTLLVELDARMDRAEVKRLEAQQLLARTTLDREERLSRSDATSRATLDTARATLAEADAALASQRAFVDKKALRAPFAGQLGIRHVDEGEYVAPGAELVTLQSLDALFVDFAVSQRHLESLVLGAPVEVTVDAYRGEFFEASVEAIEPRAESGTRAFPVRARLPNLERRLRPGMFAKVGLVIGSPREAVTIPQTAVGFDPFGNYLFRIDGGDSPIAKRIYVQTGARRGDQVEIRSGLAAGERVVTTGLNKLADGAPLRIDDSTQPDNNPDPRPPSGSADMGS